jgi:lysozyme
VLISMAFNLGVQGLLGFTRMLSYSQDGDYSGAAEEMLSSKWATQVGNRAVELAGMMENG